MRNWFERRTVDSIKDTLTQKQPLPTGVTEFHAWADRIIAGACLTADADSQKFALANTLMHLGPTVAFEQDIYFIHTLRKFAVNQVADAMRTEIRDQAKARLAEEEKNKTPAAVTPPLEANAKVLDIQGISEVK